MYIYIYIYIRGEICPCPHCRWQCKIFASGVNFSIFTHFLCFFLTKTVEIRWNWRCKIFSLKIRRCNFLDKFHVCTEWNWIRYFTTRVTDKYNTAMCYFFEVSKWLVLLIRFKCAGQRPVETKDNCLDNKVRTQSSNICLQFQNGEKLAQNFKCLCFEFQKRIKHLFVWQLQTKVTKCGDQKLVRLLHCCDTTRLSENPKIILKI